ncbi:cytochrome d ubiquinol oxidase subunit II [Pseudomonas migulae]
MDAGESALMAARMQFALTISFHIVLAALTIGLANFLMVLEALWLWRGQQRYLDVYRYWLGFRSRLHALPLFAALGVFVLAFALMIMALYPLIVPPHLTLQAAASSPTSQAFMLIGFAVLIPVTLIYNTYGFRVFSGKVRAVRD